MLLFPAVDIAAGRCVRLLQGEPERQTVYGDDPARMAVHWQSEGARALHVVDLDGALAQGQSENAEQIEQILRSVRIPVQVAGGLRNTRAVHRILRAGAARAVVGTRAVRDPDWAMRLCQGFPGRIVIALDAREGRVAVEGWRETLDRSPAELAGELARAEPAAFLYTDVARDGMLNRPNFEGVEELLAASEVPVIASGGVASLEDLRRLAERGADAVVVGKALYEERFTLPEALEAAAGSPSRLAPEPADSTPKDTE